ncbi:TetR/AcrR family transcriptional regulator [Streptomyces muensis]|uniref:TetR family transcriptional regulator n=1 Tax=Streptomyces muensis TaxID=1077944 RepID=A0A9X1PST2_STRM4|nr:TetR family transcriptional regulator [Streptomyces muensis]MCF1592351.1 TetR family transcriptional regulator [Streptomyces muensis]
MHDPRAAHESAVRADGTAPEGLRERKKQVTRAALMEAAMDLYERDGFHATTLEDIAAVVGVSARTLTRYFGSKEGVVLGYEDDYHAIVAGELARRPAGESPLEALRASVLAALGAEGVDSGRYLRLQRLIITTPALLAKSLERTTEESHNLAGLLAERMGASPDADMRPRLVVSVVQAALQTAKEHWLRGQGDPSEDLTDLVRHALDLLGPGLTPPLKRPG